jgi:hypothetical protein
MMSELKKVFSEKDTAIQLNAFSPTRAYGFTCQNFENDTLISTLHYEVDVLCTQSANNNFFFDVNRKQVYIDNSAPDLKIEQIADACSQALFPMRVKVSQEGNMMDIINHNDIKERWIPIKERLLKYYKGNIITEILLKIETTLVNKSLLKDAIGEMWFFHLYFKPLYTLYKPQESLHSIWESPVFGNQIITYDIQQSIEEYYSVSDKIFINIKGRSIDERSIKEVLNRCSYPKSTLAGMKVKPLESQMEVQYKLYGEDRSIFSIIGTYQTTITDKKQRTTQVEIYHLPENGSFRPPLRAKQKDMSFLFEEDIPVKEKGSFWSRFEWF